MSAAPKSAALSAEEVLLLAEDEAIISRGLKEFIGAGKALGHIRACKLYRADYKTFEVYAKKRWNLGRSHVYRLIEAAGVVQNLSPAGGQMLDNERQARALVAVPPQLRDEVLQRIEALAESVTEPVVNRILLDLLNEKSAEGGSGGTFAPPLKNQSPQPCAKPRIFVPRGHEQQRLALQDAMNAGPADVKTKKAREIAGKTIELARATAERWEELLAQTEGAR